MRAIKFRVYCYKTERLYSNVDKIEWLISGDVIRASTIISECDEHHMHNGYDGYPNNKKNFVLQQYLGIKDINGIGIYEGDYCKFYINDNGIIKRYVVEVIWSNICAGFKLFNPAQNENDFFDINPNPTLEVIGNIYQSNFYILLNAANRDFQIDEILE